MTTEEKVGYISDHIDDDEILAQVAEEAAELAQAALKLRRSLTGKNPTPKSVDACEDEMLEELEDTYTVVNIFYRAEGVRYTDRQITKIDRWYNRLKEAEKNG